MNPAQIEIQLIAIVVAVACALPGVFLVLRRMALMSDAISHAILLGIVLAFFVVKDLASPLLVIAAALTGVLTVSLVELLNKTKLVKEDAAIGLVFPVLFSMGVILISRFAGDVHLDTDAVLLGELAFAPFNRFEPFGYDIGPITLYVMAGILLLNLLFIIIFYKELKVATFDPGLAASIGLSPAIIHYALMSLVSVTAVGAFDAVGSILVVALMIAPPAAAYLMTNDLKWMIIISAVIGILSAVTGYWCAHIFDVSIAGSMATMTGVFFLLSFFLAPKRGMLSIWQRRSRQKWEFAIKMLVVHLSHHENLPEAKDESRIDHLQRHFEWNKDFAERVVRRAEKSESIITVGDIMELTDKGRQLAGESVVK
ncbi:MAG: metal ABC transporter permease [candidate division Zixibacteria bacterium]|nr:metal ABC transporter permease [candidate division Zixibacteria bacterium]